MPAPRSPKGSRTHLAAQRRYRERVYGLTPTDQERLSKHQNGRCAICQRATGRSKALSVDHCHRTGLARGYLCTTCNRMLGHLRDDAGAFMRAAQYLLNSPCDQLGIKATFQGQTSQWAPTFESALSEVDPFE